MSTRGRSGIVRGLLGSVTDRVLHIAPAPVLIVRSETAPSGGSAKVANIICPVDGSSLSELAVSHAADLAHSLSAKVVLVHSVGHFTDALIGAYRPEAASTAEMRAEAATSGTREIQAAQAYVERVQAQLSEKDVASEVRVERGRAREQIIGLAESMPGSMIVMTTRGRSGATRWVVGSVADGVIRTAPVPTLVIRPDTDAANA